MGWHFFSYVKATHIGNAAQFYLPIIFFNHIMCHDYAAAGDVMMGDVIAVKGQRALPDCEQDKVKTR